MPIINIPSLYFLFLEGIDKAILNGEYNEMKNGSACMIMKLGFNQAMAQATHLWPDLGSDQL